MTCTKQCEWGRYHAPTCPTRIDFEGRRAEQVRAAVRSTGASSDREICEALKGAIAVWDAIGVLCSIGLR